MFRASPMTKRPRNRRPPALVTLVGVLAALGAGAYVLPGSSILRRMVGARGELSFTSLKADGSMHFYGPGVREAGAALGLPTDRPELEADGSVYLKLPGRCRIEARAQEGNAVASISSGGRKRVEGTELPALSEAVQEVCALLAGREGNLLEGRDAVDAHLRALGIDSRATSLARFGGAVVYVLGAQAPGRPQFWVYKDTFWPARVLHKDAKGTAWDVRFQDYSSSATGEMLPRSIEVWRSGERLMRFTALAGDTHTALADKLF